MKLNEDSHDISSFQSFQGVKKLTFFLARKIEVLNHILDRHSAITETYVPTTEVLDDQPFKLSTSPRSVTYQYDDRSDELLGITAALSRHYYSLLPIWICEQKPFRVCVVKSET